MKFRTEVNIPKWPFTIDHSHTIVSLGSCFANNIAAYLSRRKFRVISSPTGILFNPASIANAVDMILDSRTIRSNELIECDGVYLHHDFHSSISGYSPESAIANMQSAIDRAYKALHDADYLILTLGTAWVYKLANTGHIVANCHKQPASMFRREMLSIDEIVASLERIISRSNARIILTLSPIRHISDGLEDNSLSKALLRVAIDDVCRRHSNVYYFPSYEILLDDLRDYRFYGDDLVHPSTSAIEYIAEKFLDAAISPATRQRMQLIESVMRGVEHRPNNPQSEAYKEFCRRMLRTIEEMEHIDFCEEKRHFERMLQINL